MDQFVEKIKDIKNSIDGRIFDFMSLIGAFYVGRELLKPICGFWRHFLRPRRNLSVRYSSSWAVVTGSSDGIGEALCHQLAKSGINIVMVSRTESKMNQVAKDLKSTYGVESRIVPYDFTILTSAERAKELADKVEAATQGLDIGILVNNVGMAWAGSYHTQSMQKIFDLLYVNCAS
jgi:17beta-estradiol 17-dehydrogenase / very-long-chain 3-oxoacyl-CoA reductase